MSERIDDIGYINADRQHALISVFDPPLLNASTEFAHANWRGVQVALSIEAAADLYQKLGAFLADHKVRMLH